MDAVRTLCAIALLGLASTAAAEVTFPGQGLTADPRKSVVVRDEAPHHQVVVDPTPFDTSTPGTVLPLPGTDGAPVLARFEMLRADTDGNRTWIGRVDTEAGPQAVVITFGTDAVFGRIPQRSGPALEVTTLDGTPWVVEASANPPRPCRALVGDLRAHVVARRPHAANRRRPCRISARHR